jgi:rhamnose utilization protein RhaD (predicted bifunctional aldolase and dehydrogenase)
MSEPLADLVRLSLELGDPARDYVILSEGNVSARIDWHSFWVTASGVSLGGADAPGAVVAVEAEPVLAALRREGPLESAGARGLLRVAQVGGEPGDPGPSIDSFLHAVCLARGGAAFVGHTHPTPVNALLCSCGAEAAYAGPVLPEEEAVMGPAPLLLPYAEPGLELGRVALRAFDVFFARHGEPPRVVLLANHGLVVLGATPEEVAGVTAAVVKGARIRLGALAAGGVRFI